MQSDNHRKPRARSLEPRPVDRGHIFHTKDVHRVLLVFGHMEDTKSERFRINAELEELCRCGVIEKVDRGVWRRILKTPESGRPRGKAK